MKTGAVTLDELYRFEALLHRPDGAPLGLSPGVIRRGQATSALCRAEATVRETRPAGHPIADRL